MTERPALHKVNLIFIKEDIMQQNMTPTSDQERILIQKIRTLSPDKITEVEDFVDFLSQRNRDRKFLQASNKLSEDAFRKVWDNPEDDAYDNL